jgi:hypothetical protein
MFTKIFYIVSGIILVVIGSLIPVAAQTAFGMFPELSYDYISWDNSLRKEVIVTCSPGLIAFGIIGWLICIAAAATCFYLSSKIDIQTRDWPV